ncbi:MAG TPA: copper-binding protein [bacterium]|jgi:Cu/Ag efflux protein CusF|nr:copper-binding protein [bacterium]
MKKKPLFFLLGLACTCCMPRAALAAELFHGRGVVIEIKDKGAVLVIEHEDIPGLMKAMTMPFELADPSLSKGVKVGDTIRFTLEHKGHFWPIIALKKTKTRKPALSKTPESAPTMAPMNMQM